MRRSSGSWIAVLLVATFLVVNGCATKTQTVTTYEEIGSNLYNAYWGVIDPACKEQRLSADKCQKYKDVYNEARRQYIKAGDVLKLYVNMDTAPQEQAQLYAQLTGLVIQMTLDMTRFAIEAGIVK